MNEVIASDADLASSIKFALSWADKIFDCLSVDALYSRPIPLRHDCIFYLGHLPAFAWNQIFRFGLSRRSFNPHFDSLFERGIDPLDVEPGAIPMKIWPKISLIVQYKERIELELLAFLARDDWQDDARLQQLINIVLEHYLMHIETFLYIIHQVPHDLRGSIDVERPLPALADVCNKKVIHIPGGHVTLGQKPALRSFGWCNEFGEERVRVSNFAMDRFPVSNKDFLEFVESGAYTMRSLWTPESWDWIQQTRRRHPQFWLSEDGKWYHRGLNEIAELPLSWPAWVSHAEASAYARWKKARLMTEPEFHRAAYGTDSEQERTYPWGDESPDTRRGNFGLRNLSPVAIGSHPHGASYFGVEELTGNGWEWTGTAFAPFRGFKPFPSYPGYSSDFFDGRHFVMKGASPVTAEHLLRRSFRNWYQPHFPYTYAKFRCVYEMS